MQRSTPRVNITESKEGFKLDLLAPGFHKEDLKMNVENDTLTIVPSIAGGARARS